MFWMNMPGHDKLMPIVQAMETSSLNQNSTRHAHKVIEWLEAAPHFTEGYC